MHADEAKEKFSEANRLYKAGSYAAALVLLEELRAAFPVEKNVLYAYTLCLQSLGRRDDALISVNQLQALGDPRAEQLRASLMTRQELPRLEPRTVRRKQIIVGVAVGVVILAAIGLAYSRGVFNSHAQNLQSANSAEGPSAFTTSQPSTVFNLDTEVKCIEDEIQQGKGVPPVLDKSNPNWKYWQRESYQDIIDATLKARLGGRADQIEVPNNIIGKNPLRIRYISKNPPTEMVWGDDEDIVYITAKIGYGRSGDEAISRATQLIILPGTIVLFSAFNNDEIGGEMPLVIRDNMRKLWSTYTNEQDPLATMCRDTEVSKFMPHLHVFGTLLARGSQEKPILFVSDSVDYKNEPFSVAVCPIYLMKGVLDYCAFFNLSAGALTDYSITARALFDAILFTARGGPGYVYANYFGDSGNETIGLGFLDNEEFSIIRWNVFRSTWNPGVVLGVGGTRKVLVEQNSFLTGGIGYGPNVYDMKTVSVKNNNFIISGPSKIPRNPSWIVNQHPGNPDVTMNYWGETFGSDLHTHMLNLAGGDIRFEPRLDKPVPMPFKTGIPEIDAIYKPPVKPSSSKPSAWSHLRLPVDFNGTRVGIDYSKYLNPPSFDLQKEVDRVLSEVKSGKGVPPVLDTSNPYHALWERETYQPIIDGAREAFHKHRDPKTGKPGTKEETITVPGNVTGKDDLVVRYFSADFDNPVCLGDDEDIVYFTGETNFMNQLVILPGTILLAASFQNDRNAGAMTPDMIQTLARAFAETKGADGPCQRLVNQDQKYLDRLLSWGTIGPLIAKGMIDKPIVIYSDASLPVPYSFYRWGFHAGIIDYSLSGDADQHGTIKLESVVSHSAFDNYLSVCKGGSGYLIACYFGRAWNGNVEVYPGNEAHILFNFLNNPIAPLGTLCLGLPEGGPPMRVAVENNFLVRGGIGTGWPEKSPVIFLSNKDNILQDP